LYAQFTSRYPHLGLEHARRAGEHEPISALQAPQPVRCDVVDEPGRVRVAPVGELDLLTAEPLVQTVRELRRSGVEHLVLDLRGLSFIDSSGVRLAFDSTPRWRVTACDSNWCRDLRTSSGSSS
jgi:hypothetical protein